MNRLERIWESQNRNGALTASAATILVIAAADWWITPYISLGLLYLFPIMLAAGFLPRWAILLLCAGCAVLAETFGLADRSFVRLAFEWLALSGCGLFVAEFCRSRRLTQRIQERLRALVETSPAAIITVNDRGVVELANSAADELMLPNEGHLAGQPIAAFVPELQHALRRESGTQFRASMRCQLHRGDCETSTAEVWFSTYRERGVPRLAAIIAEVCGERPAAAPSEPARLDSAPPPSLNDRQIAVLRLLFEGVPNSELHPGLR
jgi:PAS domain S-box-containing protein